MIDIRDIDIDDTNFRIGAFRSEGVTARALESFVNSMAREVEKTAKRIAPRGKGENPGDVPGTLKKTGIIRQDTRVSTTPPGDFGVPGSFVTEVPAIGGGFSVRGGNFRNRGQFSRQISKADLPGRVFHGGGRGSTYVEARIILNPLLPHARFVHEGTGIHGPLHAPITPRVAPYLVFRWHGRGWRKGSVRGQKPQPFLTEAYVYVNNVYAPAKLTELRAKLAAEL